MLWTSSVIYVVTPLLWLVKTPADMNELRDLHSSALILIASKIIMAMLAIRRGYRTLVHHYYCSLHRDKIKYYGLVHDFENNVATVAIATASHIASISRISISPSKVYVLWSIIYMYIVYKCTSTYCMRATKVVVT